MAKKTSKKTTVKKNKEIEYAVRVVYGFRKKLKIVLLGELKNGEVEDGMRIQIKIGDNMVVGTWEILEVLHTDFINSIENPNYKGLMVRCKNLSDFELLRTLRVYDEVITIISEPATVKEEN